MQIYKCFIALNDELLVYIFRSIINCRQIYARLFEGLRMAINSILCKSFHLEVLMHQLCAFKLMVSEMPTFH